MSIQNVYQNLSEMVMIRLLAEERQALLSAMCDVLVTDLVAGKKEESGTIILASTIILQRIIKRLEPNNNFFHDFYVGHDELKLLLLIMLNYKAKVTQPNNHSFQMLRIINENETKAIETVLSLLNIAHTDVYGYQMLPIEENTEDENNEIN